MADAASAQASIPAEKVEAQQEWFVCPAWVGFPDKGVHLEVRKGGKVVERILLDKSPYYMVGRLATAVDIPMEHNSISRAHCVFVHHRSKSVYLIDLASHHGVFVNGERVPSKQTVRITEKDEIRVGASTRTFKLNCSVPPKIEEAKLLASKKRPAEDKGESSKRAKTGDAVRTFHILLKHTGSRNPKSFRSAEPVTRTKEEAAEQLTKWKAEILEAAEGKLRETFCRFAAKYSDCPSSKKGGDLGMLERGKMLKEVEDVAFELKPGGISDPVSSASGLHIVYRHVR
ncbi:Buparvaquone-resistant peptidyl-prolyl cis-trans isomerase NIMA-interacting 1 [Diplonema papillatum]|nr:Buparvaquone-resistant peptidyl-prolyl cis-trans isomerase NIMA-interacting 1 [Diplonema papillatum]WGM50065.1 NIPP1 [Diplonema papillatum]